MSPPQSTTHVIVTGGKIVVGAAATAGIGYGIGYGLGVCYESIDAMELELVKTTNTNGVCTGHGYMFENIIVRENPGSYKVNNPGHSKNSLLREKNGVDIKTADCELIQAKCCNSPERTYKSLVNKDGQYRYPRQTAYVPKGQSKAIRKMAKDDNIHFPIRESNKTYDEVRDISKAWTWSSIKFDLTDPGLCKGAAYIGAMIALITLLYQLKTNKSWLTKICEAAGYGFVVFALSMGGMLLLHNINECNRMSSEAVKRSLSLNSKEHQSLKQQNQP